MNELTKEIFDTEVGAYSGKVLVDFYAPWCAECNALSPVIEAVSQKTNGVKFCAFNCDNGREFVMDMGIMSIPTIIIFENSKEKARLIGMQSEDDIVNALNK